MYTIYYLKYEYINNYDYSDNGVHYIVKGCVIFLA